jgi:translation initiation factor IF-1
MKQTVETLTPGTTIGMLDGVVKVVDVQSNMGSTTVYVSIGKLKRHPVRFNTGDEVEVYTMPPGLAPWYGV